MACPAGACDGHMHIYDARYPAVPGARFRPPDAPVTDYVALARRLGLQRCVVVTPSTYGLDNRCTLDAMAALRAAGLGVRGVAVLDRHVDDARLQALHAAGIRGVRFQQTLGGTDLADLEPLAERIAPLGWHVELLLPDHHWPAIGPRLAALPLPVVLDHFGRLPWPAREHVGHRTLVDLVARAPVWVKLSGAYLQAGVAEADWVADARAMTRTLLAAAPRQLLWGSNWPHPSVRLGLHQAPDDARLLQMLADWVEDPAALQAILVDNPARLHDFEDLR